MNIQKIAKKSLLFFTLLFLSSCSLINRADSNSQSEVIEIISEEETSEIESEPSKEESESLEEEKMLTNIPFFGIEKIDNLNNFISQVKNGDNWNNDAIGKSVIISPYYHFLDSSNQKSDIYASLVTYGVHSFSTLDIGKNDNKIKLVSVNEIKKVSILSPSTTLPTYEIIDKYNLEITFLKRGTYTFIFNDDKEKALTFFVEKESEFIDTGKNIRTFEPGKYNEGIIANKNEILYFKKGVYEILKFTINSDSEIYFEDGTLIKAINPSLESDTPILNPDWANMIRYPAFFSGLNVNNFKMYGKAIIDLGYISWHGRLGLFMENSKNITLEDFMLVNSPEWTLELACVLNARINNVKIFGYRQNSDGFAIVDSNDVQVKNCFARSGDDLFEVKSMYGASSINVSNIIFENNTAWPDKCRGYGIIHETQRNISNVKFLNSIICNAPADWMDALGCLVIIVGNDATISDITFSGINIYDHNFYPINLSIHDGGNGNIENINFHNIYYKNDYKIRIFNDSTSGHIKNVRFSNIFKGGIKQKSSKIFNTEGNNISEITIA